VPNFIRRPRYHSRPNYTLRRWVLAILLVMAAISWLTGRL
jgi:hypothetical protein